MRTGFRNNDRAGNRAVVRRGEPTPAGDAIGFDPSWLPACYLWVRPRDSWSDVNATLPAGGGGAIAAVRCRATGRVGVQGTAGARPTMTNADGFIALSFDGVNDFVDFSGAAADIFRNVPGAWVTAGVMHSKVNNELFFASLLGSTFIRYTSGTDSSGAPYITGRRLDGDSRPVITSPTALGLSVFAVQTALFDYVNALAVVAVNGLPAAGPTAAFTPGYSSDTPSTNVWLGNGFNNSFAGGRLGQFVAYQRAPSAADRVRLERLIGQGVGVRF